MRPSPTCHHSCCHPRHHRRGCRSPILRRSLCQGRRQRRCCRSRGGCHCRHHRRLQRGRHDHCRHRWLVRTAGRGGRCRTWGAMAPGDRCARCRCCRPAAPPAWAQESGTAALAVCHCDGRPLPGLPPPCPRRGWTKGQQVRQGTAMLLPPPLWRPWSPPSPRSPFPPLPLLLLQ